MYYKLNEPRLGHKKALVYANKYINFLQIKTPYLDMETVKFYAPHFINNVPKDFTI
tara:strand:+ start:519 stop:686 length:168 start_codon:yes stop_codon:yes gene_type:complete